MRKAISYGRQTIEKDDIEAVLSALSSDMLTQGPLSAEFEDAIKEYTGAKYAVVCSNGTAALHLACLASGIKSGDGVLTSPITFLASANAALYAGADPIFADIDADSFNISPSEIEKKLKYNRHVKALIPVHFAGLPCDMESIHAIAKKHGHLIIEDACHALGASYKGKDGWHRVGSCAHSDMTVFSFHPVKSITTGEGGAVTTNDKALYERLKLLRSHGVTKEREEIGNYEGPWYYEMQALGYNFRLSDIQSALGISQLKKLDRFIKRRTEIAELYTNLLTKYPFLKIPAKNKDLKSAFHLYPIEISFEEIGASKQALFELMKNIGINLQVHYIPVHLQPYYRKRFGYRKGDFPAAEKFYSKEVSLPIYPLLTDEEAGAVAEALISTISYAAVSQRGAANI